MGPRKRVVAIEVVGKPTLRHPAFLTLVRLRYRNVYEDGSKSRAYHYEHVHRRGFDAVAIALYHTEGGEPAMAYRPGIRVPVYFRKALPLALPDRKEYLHIPEAVAGSLEPGDRGIDGLVARVVAEVAEETGFQAHPEDVESLGASFFPSHGQSSEKIHLCAVRVRPGTEAEPSGDGSVNEADAPPVVFMTLREILQSCARGDIEDPKVEILAWRLCLKLSYDPLRGAYLRPGGTAGDFLAALEEGGWARPKVTET